MDYDKKKKKTVMRKYYESAYAWWFESVRNFKILGEIYIESLIKYSFYFL